MYGDQFAVAPFSVLVDPIRAERVFGLAEGKKFSDKVLYIYRKQLEEADIIVITKNDLISAERIVALHEHIAAEFPHAKVRDVSVRAGDGVHEWFAEIGTGEAGRRSAMKVDYEIYAEGEALLGWLNATVELDSESPFDANSVLEVLAKGVQSCLTDAEIAHLKMTLSPANGLGDIAVINLVRSDFVPELSLRLEEPITGGQVILNLRAEAAPEDLEAAVRHSLDSLSVQLPGLRTKLTHLERFRPGKPQPTHRLEVA
jgi:G3E family GTPase